MLSCHVTLHLLIFNFFHKDVVVDEEDRPLDKMIGFVNEITLTNNHWLLVLNTLL